MRSIAQFLSVVFHPIFIPTYATFLLVWSNPFFFGKLLDPDSFAILRTVVLYSVVYPLITLVLMRTLDFISSYNPTDYRERILLGIPTVFYFFWTYVVQHKSPYNQAVADIPLAATICVAIAMVLTATKDKISMHAMGMGALLSVMLVLPKFSVHDLSTPLLCVILLSGLICTCRLYLQAHTLRQVYMGFVVGFLVQSLAFIF